MSGLYICELLQNFQKSKEMKYDLFEGEKKMLFQLETVVTAEETFSELCHMSQITT